MKRAGKTAAWVIVVLVICAPLSAITTLLLVPLWRWIEARFAIESIGHSGPADWCFEMIYALWVMAGMALLWRQLRNPKLF